MKRINVTVTLNKNWRGDKYALFSTEEHGDIVELDYPNEEHAKPRVFNLKADNDYVTFSSLPQGIIGAETAVKTSLLDLGFYVNKIVYPSELLRLRRQAFKQNF